MTNVAKHTANSDKSFNLHPFIECLHGAMASSACFSLSSSMEIASTTTTAAFRCSNSDDVNRKDIITITTTGVTSGCLYICHQRNAPSLPSPMKETFSADDLAAPLWTLDMVSEATLKGDRMDRSLLVMNAQTETCRLDHHQSTPLL